MTSIYGVPYDPIWEAEKRKRAFDYLKALIEAEKINPDLDYDNDRENLLLKQIAVSDCDYFQRGELVRLLNINKGND